MGVEDPLVRDVAGCGGEIVGEDYLGGCADEVQGLVVEGPADGVWDCEVSF